MNTDPPPKKQCARALWVLCVYIGLGGPPPPLGSVPGSTVFPDQHSSERSVSPQPAAPSSSAWAIVQASQNARCVPERHARCAQFNRPAESAHGCRQDLKAGREGERISARGRMEAGKELHVRVTIYRVLRRDQRAVKAHVRGDAAREVVSGVLAGSRPLHRTTAHQHTHSTPTHATSQ